MKRCITFDRTAQDALPDHIKAKMKEDREKSKVEYSENFRKKIEHLHEMLVKKYNLDMLESLDLYNELMYAIERTTIETDSLDLCQVFLFDESKKGFDYWNHILNRHFFNEMKKAHEPFIDYTNV